MSPSTITKIDVWPVDIPMTEPFVVATGQRTMAENAFVRVTLESGTMGYGEMAPFPEVGGESRASCLPVAEQLATAVLGHSALSLRRLSHHLFEAAPSFPAVRCGLETAIVDALCRDLRIPLWGFWGGADVRARETDITLPIASAEQTLASAAQWYTKGFRTFKTKVGLDVDDDLRRLEALHRGFSNIGIIADGNQGFTEADCRRFMSATQKHAIPILLLEQPLHRADFDGMAGLRRDFKVRVAADEAVRSAEDLHAVLARQAADVVNIKITKSGLICALDLAVAARTAGLELMSGGMVETRVAMGCSFAAVLGLGGFEFLDLDTPLLMASDPVHQGYRYQGPTLEPPPGPGLDLTLTPHAPVTTVSV